MYVIPLSVRSEGLLLYSLNEAVHESRLGVAAVFVFRFRFHVQKWV